MNQRGQLNEGVLFGLAIVVFLAIICWMGFELDKQGELIRELKTENVAFKHLINEFRDTQMFRAVKADIFEALISRFSLAYELTENKKDKERFGWYISAYQDSLEALGNYKFLRKEE